MVFERRYFPSHLIDGSTKAAAATTHDRKPLSEDTDALSGAAMVNCLLWALSRTQGRFREELNHPRTGVSGGMRENPYPLPNRNVRVSWAGLAWSVSSSGLVKYRGGGRCARCVESAFFAPKRRKTLVVSLAPVTPERHILGDTGWEKGRTHTQADEAASKPLPLATEHRPEGSPNRLEHTDTLVDVSAETKPRLG